MHLSAFDFLLLDVLAICHFPEVPVGGVESELLVSKDCLESGVLGVDLDFLSSVVFPADQHLKLRSLSLGLLGVFLSHLHHALLLLDLGLLLLLLSLFLALPLVLLPL